jgi:hypothetical protein
MQSTHVFRETSQRFEQQSPLTLQDASPVATHGVVVVVVLASVVVVVVVVVVSQMPALHTSPLVQAEPQVLLTQVRHCVPSQPPQLRVPPQPSETIPQVSGAHDPAGVQQAPLKMRAPVGQQRPNRAVAFLTMGFAQSRLQQLMFVEHTVPFDLQPPARAGRGPMASVARSARANMVAVTRAIFIIFSFVYLGRARTWRGTRDTHAKP